MLVLEVWILSFVESLLENARFERLSSTECRANSIKQERPARGKSVKQDCVVKSVKGKWRPKSI